ncbi:TonB-dependent hemoglobin/transferrin/lactoferrin family receptor [Pseudomonas sp. P7]|uniref:TonB-dependent receptor n=1 Tax=Pseudomonas TaxID=286 RepID=UPI000BCB55BD|nr:MULTISPECIES: TonB-dependent receptor [Pseudomonas]MBA2924430.1 TonB-dependent hemoglobin/transferrin/lactoferrin family receptor [Pseudomonas sivasensis]OYT80947.1 MAG: ligand-gated channel [Pseudomonas sp. PGPPP2]
MSALTKGRITGSRLALAIHLGLFAAAAPVYAAQPQAGTAQPVVLTFDIPAQSLGSAVLAFADQAGLQVLFDSQRLQGLNSTALKGSFSVQEGLGRLLGAAPVEYRFTSERQVTLNRVSDDHAGAMTVGTTTITANTNGQASDWVYQTPKSVAVISRDMIDKRPPRHAADMLEETAGVYTAVNQRDPGLSVNIRGVQDYGRVNMNIDGMRQNFNVNGHQQRNGTLLIDPEFISSIEIDKGSQSGQGGAAVLGGIASFKTLDASEFLKDGKEYGGRIRAGHGIGELGNGTNFNGSGVFAFGDERGDVLVGYSERHFGDYRSGNHNDQKLGTNLRARKAMPGAFDDWLNSEVGDMGSVTRSQIVKLGLNLPNDQRVQLSYLESDSDSNDAWAYTSDDNQSVFYQRVSKNNLNAKNFALDYSYTPDNPLIDLKAKAYYVTTQLDRTNAPNGATVGTGNYVGTYTDHFQTDTWGLQGDNTSRFDFGQLGHVSWNYGGELYQDEFKPRTNKVEATNDLALLPYAEGGTPGGKRTIASLFNNLQYEYGDWLTLDGGLRYDRYRLEGETGMTLYRRDRFYSSLVGAKRVVEVYDVDREEGQFSPTFGIAVKPGLDWLQLYTRWGKGWRPPAVTETFMTGRPHGGGSGERVFPNPYLKPEESKDWEVGVNVFKEGLLFGDDRLGIKVAYFDTKIENFSFLNTSVSLPETTSGGFLGTMAYVNNTNPTRFRGLEYQLNYDMGRVYANLSFTHMIGSNEFCSKNYYMGGAKKNGPSTTRIERYVDANGVSRIRLVTRYEVLDDDVANNRESCGRIMGNATYMPADRGSLTLGARFLDKRLDTGVRVRYSAGNGENLNQQGYDLIDQALWPQYTLYDLYGSYWMTDHLNISLALENATNEAYFVAMGDANNLSLARGRTLSGMLEYKF